MALTGQDIQEIENLKNKYFNEHISKSIKDSTNWIGTISDREKELIKILLVSYGLFTGGNVPTVRKPELFDDSKSDKIETVVALELSFPQSANFLKSLGLDLQRKITKEDYQNAHDLLSVVSRIKDPQTYTDISLLYRGIHSVSQNLITSWIQKDAIFDLGNIISCTWDASVAGKFLTDGGPYRVFLTIENNNGVGAIANNVSRYSNEDEAILSGKIKTKKARGLKMIFNDKTGFNALATEDPNLILTSIMFVNAVKAELSKIPRKDLKSFEVQIGEFKLTNRTPEGIKIIKTFQATEREILNQSIAILVELVEEGK